MKKDIQKELMNILLKQSQPLSTKDLSEAIGRSRSLTSNYLNNLAKLGKVEKSDSRPVYWSLAVQDQDLVESQDQVDYFAQFIGSQGSVKEAIKQIKAAVNYPPIGLPILLNGNSGVGKSFLAQLIYKQLHALNKSCSQRLTVFNCADYANNPELMSSLLFGHVKGAFTGADSKRDGLLKTADQGLLFLDEVHRLSYENQEKLFQFLDKGYFRPLGEENEEVYSKVRLVLATSEDPEKVLLPTFYRRIPLTIKLPDFHQRPYDERIKLVETLFRKESKRLDLPIKIDIGDFEFLVNQKYPGNIGSLYNNIQLLCAQAFEYQENADFLLISNQDHINHVLTIDAKEGTSKRQEDIEQLIIKPLQKLFDQESIYSVRSDFIGFTQDHLNNIEQSNLEPVILYQTLVKSCQAILGKNIIAGHVETFIRFYSSYQSYLQEITFPSPIKKQILAGYSRTYSLARELCKGLDPKAYKNLVWYLSLLLLDAVNENLSYHALLVAHGDSTASSIQKVANQLNDNYIFDAINMPFSASVHDVIARVKEWMDDHQTLSGIIMLVDMGSLTTLYKGLKPEIRGELFVINQLSTALALEVGNYLIQKRSMTDFIEESEGKFSPKVQFFEGFDIQKNIIISSISGEELAEGMADILKKYLKPNIKTIVMNYNELLHLIHQQDINENYFDATYFVLTTTPLDCQGRVKNVNLLELLENDFDNLSTYFKDIVALTDLQVLFKDFLKFFSVEGLSSRLEFLNPEVIITQVTVVIEKIEDRFQIELPPKINFTLTMHLALMIERIILDPVDYELAVDIHQLRLNDKPFYNYLNTILYPLKQFYRIEVNDWEIYSIYAMLTSYQESQKEKGYSS
ncbi:sigma 54-interacting transcriptional regulator [Aerococcus urinae]|uniref:sigma 54-interacting transcriptional regulator n=1 Tax=Aerococcus urinae TaxID=1376 RepID=UPI00254A9980|nr:sigma 54-interacting transcriptional regulator [Aerococcus urinae]MDK6372137.1 sigma 54-interacting transcriptional regulator [Aerococcus urinae]